MPQASKLGDSIKGTTTGEHHGHQTPIYDSEGNISGYEPTHDTPCELTGTINGGCSSNVFINGQPAAILNSTTVENDCCGPGNGSISSGSSKVYINGKPLARVGDAVTPHNGTASIQTGSSNVFSS